MIAIAIMDEVKNPVIDCKKFFSTSHRGNLRCHFYGCQNAHNDRDTFFPCVSYFGIFPTGSPKYSTKLLSLSKTFTECNLPSVILGSKICQNTIARFSAV